MTMKAHDEKKDDRYIHMNCKDDGEEGYGPEEPVVCPHDRYNVSRITSNVVTKVKKISSGIINSEQSKRETDN